MKTMIKTAAWACATLFCAVSCYDDGTDCFDTGTRISISPEAESFRADGTTASGNESFTAAVIVNAGSSVSDMAWEVSAPAAAAWATVRRTVVTSIFEEAGGGIHDLSAEGFEIAVEPNTEYRRTVRVTIAAADGTTAGFEFMQLGLKADAEVSSETERLVFMAPGESKELTYTSNMGDVYKYEVVYGAGSADWLTVEDKGVGSLAVTAAPWDNVDAARTATLRITVGSAETSLASLEIPVTQNAAYDYYYMYGASADALPVAEAYELTRTAVGEYTGTLYFLRSSDGRNPVLLNKNGRTPAYPCYALAQDGTVKELASAEAEVPEGPAIDIDGVRNFSVDFNAMTWSWGRVSTSNCMPDELVATYPTKAYVTRDGGTKTWMTVGLHWDGGAAIGRYKLGSGLVSGHQTGGYGNVAPYDARNPEFDTEENGGKVVEAKDGSGRPLAEIYGRLYSSCEQLTGSPNGALNPCEGGSSALINSPLGEPGATLIDAVGDVYVLESIMPADLTLYAASAAGDAQAEAEHPNLKMQIQGICPYGWHIANLQDWKDLAYAAFKAGAADYPVAESMASYRAFGGGTLTNFAALLFTADWNIYNPTCPAEKISTAAADFGFNMFSQGWRLYKTGYDYGPGDNDPRMYAFIPLIGDYSAKKKAGWRIWNQGREANMRTNGGFDFGNGCGAAVRCVKNYK
ncbi:BACON domain-containing protein [Alistipes sp.]|uniref:BACON domain-containing protein n=1 Tax=Alistipes sp. TaxID=1872444 RepID=UPI003A8AB8AB